ncbi:MAG: hypothetical protein ACFB4J_03680 [Elainellaceae cyanobacterium]
MTYLFSGEPSACRSLALAKNSAARLGPHLDIDPQTGDYRLGDTSETGYHTLRLLAIGSLYAVNNCRDSLHALGYARPDEWSQPIPLAGNSGILRGLPPHDVMRILTKRIPLPQ